MASMTHDLQSFVRGLRSRVVAANGRAAASDSELLRRYSEHGDEAAFELLVWRHGSLVLGTCRRILGQSADVDDAFQATFLALIRHAKRIRRAELLAGWLHRVARRIAQHARSARADRHRREQQAGLRDEFSKPTGESSDLRPLLDEEIDRLPTPFRLAFTLCCLQGKTHGEAAQIVGIPVGTLRSRLARAREKLRFRLTRRGITLSAASLAIGSTTGEISAAMVNSTMNTVFGSDAVRNSAAVKLMEGALHMMLLKKIKIAATILITLTFAGGSTAWACHGLRARRRCPPPPICVVAEAPPAVLNLPKLEEKPKPPEAKEEPEPAIDPRLKQILVELAVRNKNRQSVMAQQVTRTEKTKTETRVYEGEIRFLKPDYAALRMIRKENQEDYELLVWQGKKLYEYRPHAKKLVIHSDLGQIDFFVPSFSGRQVPIVGPLSFLFGLDMDELVSRVELAVTKDVSESNPHYIYIQMRPRSESDKHQFTQAQVVLYSKSLLPRRVWYQGPNGDEIKWDFPTIDDKVKLRPVDFTPPKPPVGWETIHQPPLPAEPKKK